eukprot:403374736
MYRGNQDKQQQPVFVSMNLITLKDRKSGKINTQSMSASSRQQKFDSLNKFNHQRTKKQFKVMKIGFIFGRFDIDLPMGLIGIRSTITTNSQSLGQQFKIIALKDYSEICEQSIVLNVPGKGREYYRQRFQQDSSVEVLDRSAINNLSSISHYDHDATSLFEKDQDELETMKFIDVALNNKQNHHHEQNGMCDDSKCCDNSLVQNPYQEIEYIKEIEITHNNLIITQVYLKTNFGQILVAPDDCHYQPQSYQPSPIALAENTKKLEHKIKIKSKMGIIGFKGLFDKVTGYISKLEVVENQKSQTTTLKDILSGQ